MGIHSRPSHRHSSSFTSFGSSDFESFSGCFDDLLVVEDYFAGEEQASTVDDNSHPDLPHPLRVQEGNYRPQRRRLGAQAAVAASSSPEIRALNLPFSPSQVMGGHQRRDSGLSASIASLTSVSPSSTAGSSSPMSSYCSITSLSRTTMSTLLASLEGFDFTGSRSGGAQPPALTETPARKNRNEATEISAIESPIINTSASAAMESIVEESHEKKSQSLRRKLELTRGRSQHQRVSSNGLAKYLPQKSSGIPMHPGDASGSQKAKVTQSPNRAPSKFGEKHEKENVNPHGLHQARKTHQRNVGSKPKLISRSNSLDSNSVVESEVSQKSSKSDSHTSLRQSFKAQAPAELVRRASFETKSPKDVRHFKPAKNHPTKSSSNSKPSSFLILSDTSIEATVVPPRQRNHAQVHPSSKKSSFSNKAAASRKGQELNATTSTKHAPPVPFRQRDPNIQDTATAR